MIQPNILRWKVCGMRNSENIVQVAALKPDFMGFIFYEQSPRFAAPELDENLLKTLPLSIKKTGVFVNATHDYISHIAYQFGLAALQLHGQESAEDCLFWKSEGYQVIKVFTVGEGFSYSSLTPYLTACDYFLFDSKGKMPGGTGTKFDWEILKKYPFEMPYFLSGGIGLEDITYLVRNARLFNGLFALDVNSRFEVTPGLKDIGLLEKLKDTLAKPIN